MTSFINAIPTTANLIMIDWFADFFFYFLFLSCDFVRDSIIICLLAMIIHFVLYVLQIPW